MANLLSDLGNWAAKTFTPQKTQPQQVQPSFMDRVNQVMNTKFMPNQKMTVNQAIGKATQNFSTDFGNVLRGTGGIQGQQLKNPIISKIPVISNLARLSGNTGQSIASGMGNIGRGTVNVGTGIKQGNLLKVGQGIVNTGMGAAQIISPTTPFFQTGNLMTEMRGTLPGRIGKGMMQGQTGIGNLAPNVKEQTMNILGMKIDPVVGVASLAGFTQNPAWIKIFGKTAKLAEFGLKGVALKGGVEGLIQGLDQLPDNPSQKDITNTLLTNIAMGTGAEVGTKVVGDIFKKINGTKLVQSIKEDLSNRFTSKMVDTASGPMPFWKKELKVLMGQTEDIYGKRQDGTELVSAESSIKLPDINEQSGLPPTGLEPQPQQKMNIATQLYDRLLNESRNKLNQMGPAGKNIATKIDDMYTEAQRNAGGAVVDLTNVTNKMDDMTYEGLLKGLRGQEGGLPKSSQEVQQIRNILDKVHTDAKAVGLDIGYIKDYIPQKVDIQKLKLNQDAAVQYFVNTNQFSTPEKAAQFVTDIINGTDIRAAYNRFGKPMPKKMGNLEFERILDWIPDVLRTDKKLLADYLEQAYSRIAQVKQFGKNNEIGTNLLQNINKQGYDTKLAQQILDQNLGLVRYDRTMQKASGVVRSVQGAMKLPLAAITNATQSVNTATVGGTRRTLSQIYKYTNPANRAAMDEFALRTGATLNGEMQNIMDQYVSSGKNKNILEKLIAPFFGNVENFNRVIAANVGKDLAQSKGIVNPEELLKAGQQMVDKTQFQVRPIDLPVAWNTPEGKVMTQFKSFGFRQADFVKKEILDKIVKGDLKPLARFLLIGTIANEISNNAKSFLGRKERPQDIATRIIQDLPGLGYYQDAVEAISYGMSYPKAMFPAIFDFVAGPTLADVRKGVDNTASALQGNPKPLIKETVNSIPFVGRPFVNENPQLFGGKAPIKISTTDTTGTTGTTIQTTGSTLLDKQRLSDQITELNKQKKAIYDQAGVNILGNNFGTMSDQEKISKMSQLEAQITDLENKKKMMDVKFEMPTSPQLTGNTELDKKLISKYKGQLTTEANDVLKLYEAGMMTKDEAEKNLAQIKGVVNSFAAAKKPKKITIGKIKIPKISNIKVKTFKPKKIKMPKMPKLLTSKKKKTTIKIKA